MKYLFLDYNQVVIYIADEVTYDERGDAIVEDGVIICKTGFDLVLEMEPKNLPDDIRPIKYSYIDDEFVINPYWTEPETPVSIDEVMEEVFDILEGRGEE